MNRFLTLLAVAAIAGVMYVAAAPGGLRSTGPTAKQFRALKASVTKIQKQVKQVKQLAQGEAVILLECIMHGPVGADEVGTSTTGYLFGPPQTAPTASTASATGALNLAPSTETSPQHKFFELNTSQQACVQVANSASSLTAEQAVATLAAHR
jgi:hypothetical protein